MNLYILGEEYAPDSIESIIRIMDPGAKVNKIKFVHCSDPNKLVYELVNVFSSKYQKIYYSLICPKTKGSFSDFCVFEGNVFPKEEEEPLLEIEVTKNTGKEAGNMLTQRELKFIGSVNKYPNSKKIILIQNNSVPLLELEKSFDKACQITSFRNYITQGVDIYLSSNGYHKQISLKPYVNLQDLVDQENSKKKSSKSNYVEINGNTIALGGRIKKGEKGTSDPGIGYLGSRAFIARKLDPNIEIVIKDKHGMPKTWFAKHNKFTKILKLVGATVEFPDQSKLIIQANKNTYNDYGWKYEKESEKLVSIASEIYFNNNGYDTVFSCHAGCEKTYITGLNGISHVSKNKEGIPDLVLFNPQSNELLVLEAERSSNYKAGLKQTSEFTNFIQESILPLYPKCEVKKYLTIYGDSGENKHVIFRLTSNMEIEYDSSCEEVK